jgi:hypothetical protein
MVPGTLAWFPKIVAVSWLAPPSATLTGLSAAPQPPDLSRPSLKSSKPQTRQPIMAAHSFRPRCHSADSPTQENLADFLPSMDNSGFG